jgi:drug/metabolite transporter (DMT)-like permease
VLTIVLAAALLDERADITQLWGGALILSSVVLLNASPLARTLATRRRPARLPD